MAFVPIEESRTEIMYFFQFIGKTYKSDDLDELRSRMEAIIEETPGAYIRGPFKVTNAIVVEEL
jgi:hypothetical protein